MTNEEAIKGLLNVKMQMCEETPFTEAIDIAIKAIDKQIPKEPLNVKDRIEDLRFDWTCPSCKRQFVASSYGVNHCVDCGQRLDWREGEPE